MHAKKIHTIRLKRMMMVSLLLLSTLMLFNVRVEATLSDDWIKDAAFSKFFSEDCDFPVVDGSKLHSMSDLPVWMEGIPIIIRNLTTQWPAISKWTKHDLIHSYGNRKVRSGSEASIVNSGGVADITLTLEGFLAQTTKYSMEKMEIDHNSGLTPDSFLFDTTILQSIPELSADFTIPRLFEDWDSFQEEKDKNMWHMLSVGPSRSGLPFHNHGQTWISIIHGIKHWFVYPIGFASPVDLYSNDTLAKDFMIVEQWLVNILPRLKLLPKAPLNGTMEFMENPYFINHSFGFQPLQCAQHSGDTLFLPSLWSHLTINEGETIAIGGQQALYDEERLQKSQNAMRNNLGTFEVYKDIALAIFNMANVELEDLRETFAVSDNGIILFESVADLQRFRSKTLNTVVVVHQSGCLGMENSDKIKQFATLLKIELNGKIEVDVGILEEQGCDENQNPQTGVELLVFPGLSFAELHEFDGNSEIPIENLNHIDGEIIVSGSLNEAVSSIESIFQDRDLGFGSIHSTTLYTKLRFKVALHYYWQAYLIRPFHPETITMVIELAGLSDDFETMLEIANKSLQVYDPLSQHLTNTSIASIFYNVGRTIMARGFYEQALPFLRRSLESMSAFKPALKKIITVCTNLDMKNEALDYFSILKSISTWDDITEYEHMVSRFI